MRLSDKTILVTGAGSGIGRAASLRFIAEGATVIGLDLPPNDGPDNLATTMELLGDQAEFFEGVHVDVTDLADLDRAMEMVRKRGGKLDGVMACAGVLRGGGLLDTKPEEHEQTMSVNVDGVINTVRAAVPGLRAAGGGSIVLVSSLAAFRANPDYASYVVSKHAVMGVMRVAAKEFGVDSIRVNTVHPTIVDTPMTNGSRDSRDEASFEVRTGKFLERHFLPVPFVEAEDVANAALFLLSDEARYITSVALPVDAGASA